ncbi:MAG: sigma-54 dependent transcriptional regulator [Bdellovibrionota bacterium]|nr:sigma-54 dependent transcriptional regulator [Bdellovibrionota bacterium]
MNGIKVLIIDDEKPIRDILSASLQDEDYEVYTAENGQEGLAALKEHKPHIALLDIWMPGDLDGIDVLRESKSKDIQTEFIVMSGHGTIETAVKATKLGAWDFIEKPISLDKIHILMNNIMSFQNEKSQKLALLNKLRKNIALIGDSPRMRDIKEKIANLNNKNRLVCIQGSIGVGKSLVAENIHYFSDRVGGAFVSMSCALTPKELIASEIFGFEKEAFTGAPTGKMGKIELAAGGSLFIKDAQLFDEEIIERILDFVKTSKFQRLKGTKDIYCNTRILLSFSCGEEDIRNSSWGKYWEHIDSAVFFQLEDLKNRKEDVPALFDHFANQACKENATAKKSVTEEAITALVDYSWPVNIRELKNFVERLYLLINSNEVGLDCLEYAGLRVKGGEIPQFGEQSNLKEARASFEKEFILSKLAENDGNVSKTAEMIGVERSHLHRKIKGYGIDL